MNKILNVFFDDILVYGKDLEDHIHHLKEVQEVLQESDLYANQHKCKFMHGRLDYLGHYFRCRGRSGSKKNSSYN